jgi:hypothetical protein
MSTGIALGFPALSISPIVLEGDTVAGVGNISSGFGASEVHTVNNSGEWLVESDTTNVDTDQDGVVLRGVGAGAGALYLREGQAVTSPAGAMINTFDSSVINNNVGNVSFNLFLEGTGATTNDSGIYFNTDLIIQESDIATAAGFGANTPYIGFFDTKINDNNNIMVLASIDDPNVASTVDRAIIVVNPLSFTQTRIIGEGDELIAGRFVTDFDTDNHDTAFIKNGDIVFNVDLDGDTANDGALARWTGSGFDILAREGDPSPVGGRNYGSSEFTAVDMNRKGEWVTRADLDGGTTDDTIIVRNGLEVIAQEGMSLASIGGVFTFTAFGSGPVLIDDNGDVLWFGDWNDADTTRDTGLFLNDKLIVQEGVTQVNGMTVTAVSGVTEGISMSDSGQWIIFEGAVFDDVNGLTLEGAFLIEVPEPSTLSMLACGMLLCFRRRHR